MHDNSITLQEAIDGVIKCQHENGHPDSYIKNFRYTCNRLLRLADQLETTHLTQELIDHFLADDKNSRTGEYRHERYLENNRCIRFIQSYLATGTAVIKKYSIPVEEHISEGLLEVLHQYDLYEESLGLSKASLIKNRAPMRYLLEYMSSLGYQNLSDIQAGDTINAIEDMLEKHYDPSSLTTAISGMRRFYEIFPEIQKYRLEIPSRMRRKRDIIDVYTDEECDLIKNHLISSDISFRDKAICLLSFETGIRGCDICNLKLSDVDWKHSVISIVQSKTRRPLDLPIRSSFGNAMVDYLLKERPICDEKYFFLSKNAPHIKLNNTWHIVRNVVCASGVEINNRLTGTRMFRHNAASRMVRKGVPLPVISDGLGHNNPDSTMVYIATDQKTMASLTLRVPKAGDKV